MIVREVQIVPLPKTGIETVHDSVVILRPSIRLTRHPVGEIKSGPISLFPYSVLVMVPGSNPDLTLRVERLHEEVLLLSRVYRSQMTPLILAGYFCIGGIMCVTSIFEAFDA